SAARRGCRIRTRNRVQTFLRAFELPRMKSTVRPSTVFSVEGAVAHPNSHRLAEHPHRMRETAVPEQMREELRELHLLQAREPRESVDDRQHELERKRSI